MTTIADLFCCAGFFSAAARQAGMEVKYGVNHWPLACAIWAMNFPNAVSECMDIRLLDMSQIPKVDGLIASPSCKGYTRARGKGSKLHDKLRFTMMNVIEALEVVQPQFALLENVPEVRNWILWDTWVHGCNALGYAVAPHVVDSADFGVPQNRVRTFIVLTRSKAPLWLETPKMDHVPFRSVVDWDSDGWFDLGSKVYSKRVMGQIVDGRVKGWDQFLAPYYSSGSGLIARDIDRPIGTITPVDGWRVVDGNRSRMLNIGEYRKGMGAPDSHMLPSTKREALGFLGEAITPAVGKWFLEELELVA